MLGKLLVSAMLVGVFAWPTKGLACSPQHLSTAERFRLSESIFVAEATSVRTICLDERNRELEVPCDLDPDRINVYPNIEISLEAITLIKGKDIPNSVTVSGCGYGDWSEDGKTLVFAYSINGRTSAYMIPEESEDFRKALSKVRRMAR